MQRYTCLVLAFLISLTAVGSVTHARFQRRPKFKSPAPRARLKFKPVMYADGVASSSQIYRSSDGVKLTRSGMGYSTSALAHEELEKKVKAAVKIIKSAPVKEKGRVVGERVVALMGNNQASVFGTYHTVFWSIDSASLRHVLDFESQHEN